MSPPDEQYSEITKMRDRISKVEWRTEAIDQRLSQGAEAFSELRNSIKETHEDVKETHEKLHQQFGPKPTPLWKILSFVASMAIVGGGLIWTLARYPDRGEFNQAQSETQEAQEKIRIDLRSVQAQQGDFKINQVLIKNSVERQEKAQSKIEEKLDAILAPGGPR